MILLKSVFTTALILLAMLSASANASNYAEREALAKLIHELETVSVLAVNAQISANPDSRVQFQYKTLKKDLARIRMGIQEYLDSPSIEPRRYEALSGDYRR